MKIRVGHVTDAEGVARVQIDTWRTTYKGIIPDSVLDGLDYERGTERWQGNLQSDSITFVAENEAGDIVGFACCGKVRSDLPGYDCEIYALYLLKNYQGKGIGRQLVNAFVGWAIQQNYTAMIIWVLRDNPSRGFYEKLGGQLITEKIIHIGEDLIEVAYGWPELTRFEHSIKG